MTEASNGQARLVDLLGEALEHIATGYMHGADLVLAEALAVAPGHPQVHYLLAEVARMRVDLAVAIAHAATGLGWERKRPEPFVQLAKLVHQEGDSPLAARLLERALALDPGNALAQQALRAVLAAPRMESSHPQLEVLARPQTIGLAMIVRDEVRNLGRCLRAARPHFGEIVVVDTGSTDGTPALAAALGARVLHFPWTNDFAAARNHGLAALTTDWVMVLDADEELEVAPGALQNLIVGLAWPELTGVVPIVSIKLYNHSGTPVDRDPWEAMPLPRLFPREAVRYRGVAHETPELAPGSSHAILGCAAHSIEVHHSGYRPEVLRGRDKVARNLVLLRQRVLDQPDDHGVHYLLGRELVFGQHYEEGLATLRRYETLLPETHREAFFRLSLYLQAVALDKLGREDEMLATLDAAIARDPDYPSYHFLRADKLSSLGRYDEAIAAYGRAIANADYHDRHGLSAHSAIVPAHAGALAVQRRARAEALRDGVNPATPGAGRPALIAIADALGELAEGRLDDAERRLGEADRLAPTHPQVPYLQAEIALRRGDLAAALDLALASLGRNTGVAEPWALMGYLLHEDDDSVLGAACLERAVALSPDYTAARELLRQARACPRVRFMHPELAERLQALAAAPVPA